MYEGTWMFRCFFSVTCISETRRSCVIIFCGFHYSIHTTGSAEFVSFPTCDYNPVSGKFWNFFVCNIDFTTRHHTPLGVFISRVLNCTNWGFLFLTWNIIFRDEYGWKILGWKKMSDVPLNKVYQLYQFQSFVLKLAFNSK